MTVDEAYKRGKNLLAAKVPRSEFEVEYLLRKVLKINKEKFVLEKKFSRIPFLKQFKYFYLLKKRLQGENFFHLIKETEFYGLKLFINKSVFIPRPETEELVEILLKKIDKNKFYKILEVGTGSGCIALAIARHFDNVKIDAIDISKKALKVAKRNLKINQIDRSKINFLKNNIFNFDSTIKYDILISNPPYIKKHEAKKLLKDKILFDPFDSLNGGIDGLDFYRLFCSLFDKLLKKEGFMILEHGIGQRNDIINIFKNNFDFETYDDLAGIDRIILIKRKN